MHHLYHPVGDPLVDLLFFKAKKESLQQKFLSYLPSIVFSIQNFYADPIKLVFPSSNKTRSKQKLSFLIKAD